MVEKEIEKINTLITKVMIAKNKDVGKNSIPLKHYII